MKIEYVDKCLLLEHAGERVLVVGDLHLGYGGSMREAGVGVPVGVYGETVAELDAVFERLEVTVQKKLDNIVLLGDLKHEFGKILREEWKEILDFLDYLRGKTNEIVIVKGNHDVVIDSVIKQKGVQSVDYFLWNGFAFLHGDRDFPEIHDKEITHWVVGHGHPAVTLHDTTKAEKYKCFLSGTYQKKSVIIVPSFFSLQEGTDPRDFDLGLVWDFNLKKFRVRVVGENLEVLDFGLLGALS